MGERYWVSIYEINREFGGPEEGGWWYGVGKPVAEYAQFTRMFASEAQAFRYAGRLQKRLVDKLNVDRRPPSSVLCSGWYEVIVEMRLPRAYPEERPHYE